MISTKSEQYIIPAGYHNGNGSVGIADAEQAKIIAENIKSGVTILGVVATILSGKVAERKMREAVKEEVENQLRSEEN